MRPEEIKSEFNVRYYLWAREDFKREIKQEFPHLRRFSSGMPYWVMNMMSEMTLDKQQVFAGALVKRFHKGAVQTMGESLTNEENELINQYLTRSLGLSPTELGTRNRQLADNAKLPTSRRGLGTFVRKELKQLRMIQTGKLGTAMKFNTQVDGWNILTYVDTGHSHAQLMYSHHIYSIDELESIVSKDGSLMKLPISLGKCISLNSWLGISSETEWFDLTELEFDQTAKLLAKLCSHFLEIAPKLLRGLT